ncbi:MAG: transposase [Saprospiraceae bacterium]
MFIYDPGRGGTYPREHLKNFKGKFQTEGYRVYEAFESHEPERWLIGCMAHIRREFEQSLDNDAARATHALEAMQKLNTIERIAREQQMDAKKQLALRQEHARPLFV